MQYLLILSLTLLISFAQAQSPEQTVKDAEQKRFAAQVANNFAVLDQVLDNDLTYTHSSGVTDSKQSFIQSLKDGKTKYNAIDVQEQTVRVYGNTAIINGKAAVNVTSNNETKNMSLRYTDVYIKRGNDWKLVAWQSLRLAN
ncbi:hypothetical protein GCM10023189_58610 [Nibrella saemangeumensis]|uniref:DUF4440 domain-containing protein n=1 Tax=Nibrella saemangeumensis TaxID=1084526 RepID=A0ABP8NRP1_9BACT